MDADDEYVTEQGFQPTLPGEFTKLSSALALFRAARILSKVLEEVFPAMASYELSFQKLTALMDELEAWHSSLAPHLRLQFVQDKPSTGTISSRSPLLSLTYHYIRALIQRPAVCASLGNRSSSSILTMATSCKHMIQIVQLLEERGLSFSFCLNKDEISVLSGFGLLFQGLGLDSSSKILKDNSKMICYVIEILDKSKAPCAPEFRRVACSFLPLQQQQKQKPAPAPIPLSRHNSDGAMPAPRDLQTSTRKQLKAIASRFTGSMTNKLSRNDLLDSHGRRATVPSISLQPQPHLKYARTQPNLLPSYDPSHVSRSEPARSPLNMYSRPASTTTRPSAPPALKPKRQIAPQRLPNLDYLSFGNESEQSTSVQAPPPVKTEPGPTDWERLLGSLDNGQTNIYDATYGGQPVDILNDTPSLTHQTPSMNDTSLAWSPGIWAMCNTDAIGTTNTAAGTAVGQSESVLSFSSEEGLTSGEDFSSNDWGSASSINGSDAYRGIVMPELGHADEVVFGSAWDAGLNL